MTKFLVAFIFIVLAATVSAQMADNATTTQSLSEVGFALKPAVTPFSLIDLSRVKWSNSYSVTYFSGGGSSGSLGMLNTMMFYEISSKLSLSLNLGVAHNAGALWGDGSTEATILPGFQLDYHPSNNFQVTIGVQRTAGYMYPYYYRDSYRDFLMGY